MKKHQLNTLFTAILMAPCLTAFAEDAPLHPNREAYFGNLHVHTSWSFDGYINGSVNTPDDAYRWAKGEAIPGGGDGTPLQIKAPLDWYIVSDHAEYLGALPLMADPDSPVSKHPLAADVTGDDAKKSFDAYGTISKGMYSVPPNVDPILGDPELAKTVWSKVVEIADSHYKPGKFTTMAGYEWTSAPDWRNIHRVVIFRDSERVPAVPFSALDSSKPEDLWRWMDQQRSAGNDLLAVPHNGNASDGIMFPVGRSFGGSELNTDYAAARMRNEPVYEITQIKGTSETHPSLFPNDEFGDFELWDYTLAPTATAPEHKRGGYVREALIRGLTLESQGKGNPFKYGFIGDSDTHNSASTIEEDNYTGKFGFENDPKHRLQGPPGTPPEAARQVRQFSSGGVAGVWAVTNTRDGIFEAIKRKETFATSGPRLKVRFFGGFGLNMATLGDDSALRKAYTDGVPMGGELASAPKDQVPTFIVYAVKEADGANLDRIQIIKGWVDKSGKEQSKIYDVALSDDRKPGPEGKIPLVGNTVNEADASYSNSIGDTQLSVSWSDPEFDASLPAVYYARVLQIPTPRWSTYDAVRHGLERPKDLPVSIQERAWTSPIWYTP
ncbi:DUF3604 domain-containing protein [Aestuariicella hydrocarbonica]|uniref:DUF3604 domain-containing protein n=1 Tax=Pseudomaricurvus hydrocarbonicus TaxID=1470433 RepID=A0A9E5T236_9GAMM|nr:DUF3604 domain-containing protein [Aestuariicella hydrocarbonica]NHO67411.1 DUF3604 domain-containing protein [Aestuariicella hydrocarbonica]